MGIRCPDKRTSHDRILGWVQSTYNPANEGLEVPNVPKESLRPCGLIFQRSGCPQGSTIVLFVGRHVIAIQEMPRTSCPAGVHSGARFTTPAGNPHNWESRKYDSSFRQDFPGTGGDAAKYGRRFSNANKTRFWHEFIFSQENSFMGSNLPEVPRTLLQVDTRQDAFLGHPEQQPVCLRRPRPPSEKQEDTSGAMHLPLT